MASDRGKPRFINTAILLSGKGEEGKDGEGAKDADGEDKGEAEAEAEVPAGPDTVYGADRGIGAGTADVGVARNGDAVAVAVAVAALLDCPNVVGCSGPTAVSLAGGACT